MLNTDNIDTVKLESFVKKLNEFYSSKQSIRSLNVNKIQRAAVLLKKWNEENSLNSVPDLESNGDLDDIIENIESPSYSFDTDYLNSLGEDFIKKSGLDILHQDDKTGVSKFLEFIKKTSQKEVFTRLKNELSKEEFDLGFEIYDLETTVPKELYNYFLNDPGIDNLSFEINDELISDKELNYYRTIKSNNEFLEHLNQIGLNQDLKFDYTSKIITHYSLNAGIRQQSLQIRDQIRNAFNQINDKIVLYENSVLDRNEFLNNIELI